MTNNTFFYFLFGHPTAHWGETFCRRRYKRHHANHIKKKEKMMEEGSAERPPNDLPLELWDTVFNGTDSRGRPLFDPTWRPFVRLVCRAWRGIIEHPSRRRLYGHLTQACYDMLAFPDPLGYTRRWEAFVSGRFVSVLRLIAYAVSPVTSREFTSAATIEDAAFERVTTLCDAVGWGRERAPRAPAFRASVVCACAHAIGIDPLCERMRALGVKHHVAMGMLIKAGHHGIALCVADRAWSDVVPTGSYRRRRRGKGSVTCTSDIACVAARHPPCGRPEFVFDAASAISARVPFARSVQPEMRTRNALDAMTFYGRTDSIALVAAYRDPSPYRNVDPRAPGMEREKGRRDWQRLVSHDLPGRQRFIDRRWAEALLLGRDPSAVLVAMDLHPYATEAVILSAVKVWFHLMAIGGSDHGCVPCDVDDPECSTARGSPVGPVENPDTREAVVIQPLCRCETAADDMVWWAERHHGEFVRGRLVPRLWKEIATIELSKRLVAWAAWRGYAPPSVDALSHLFVIRFGAIGSANAAAAASSQIAILVAVARWWPALITAAADGVRSLIAHMACRFYDTRKGRAACARLMEGLAEAAPLPPAPPSDAQSVWHMVYCAMGASSEATFGALAMLATRCRLGLAGASADVKDGGDGADRESLARAWRAWCGPVPSGLAADVIPYAVAAERRPQTREDIIGQASLA
jgi:hypothetical protein